MNLTENLTKENFFNEMQSLYPNSMKLFCNWIDEYKKAVNWEVLFGAHEAKSGGRVVCFGYAPKFHQIPYAMQQGIWIEFVNQTLHQYFEQPEYEYSGDLEEDIKTVLKELEVELVEV